MLCATGVIHRPAGTDGQHRDGVRHAVGRQAGAVDRVDRDIAFRAGAVPDLLAVVEHRGVVLLALADDHHTPHRDRVDEGAHRLNGRAVGAVLVAPPDPAARGHRAGLCDPGQLQRQVPVGRLPFRFGGNRRVRLAWHGGCLVIGHG
jgi:hypothetical protein